MVLENGLIIVEQRQRIAFVYQMRIRSTGMLNVVTETCNQYRGGFQGIKDSCTWIVQQIVTRRLQYISA